MTFADSVSICLRKYATFSGRAGRPEYWWFFLFNILVGIAATIVDAILGLQWGNGNGLVSTVAGLALLVPGLAVGARRLHDINRTGWWQLISIVPCIGLIVLLVFFCTGGNRQPNQYGDVPR